MRRALLFIVAILTAATSFASIPRLDRARGDVSSLLAPVSETHVWASDVLAPFERQPTSGLSRALHQAYADSCTTGASGLRCFLSVDPYLDQVKAMYNPQGWNRYSYVRNNPINMTDPDGRCEAVCWGLIILGGVLLSGDVANAPAPGDALYPSPGPAGGISGASQSVGVAFASGAFGNVQTVTRYMSDGEAETARRTGNIPNTDAQGNARPTHVTTDKPLNSSAAAQKKYELPTTPTQRATVPQNRVPGGVGRTPDGRPTTSGGGSQAATSRAIPVKPHEIKPLDRTLWDRLTGWFR